MSNNYPDSLLIQQYLEGKLDPEMMHQLEKQALDDQFLWDALEGYSYTSDPGADLSILQRQLHERIVHLQENKKVFDLTWQRLSIAAAAAVLFISAGILFWMNTSQTAKKLASSPKQVDVTLMDSDSVGAVIKSAEVPGKAPASLGKGSVNDQTRINKEKTINIASAPSLPVISAVPDARSDAPPSSDTKLSARNISLDSKVTPSSSSRVSSSGQAIQESVVQPVTGWDIYRKYLEENIRRPVNEPKLSGSVYLSFEINAEGRPLNFNILKSLSGSYDAEAIRLVREGPDWKSAAGSTIRTGRVEVIFKF
ncbi:TonB protein C-terminal [Daejeonella rubra]|uniref:TonB protein C-terminal n=1 Tax=Daejeonella rubra TaxID=990371 RepID=A0A1G9Q2A9_9SPHI|nr:energy transducer TonB [Daejeonella rubra]SDM05140.1 TonB protein C-terminal [Daejeonella rubra]